MGLIGIFFFINGSFWSISKITKTNDDLYNYLFFINRSDNIVSFLKLISLPFNYIVFFYKNVIFSSFFKSSNSLFKSISSIESILLIHYKRNLFKSFRNYSVDFSLMYNFFNSKIINKDSLGFSLLSYNFFLIKKIESESRDNYLVYFLRLFFFFIFFFKKFVSNLYNMILIGIYNFGLNTVITNFSVSDLKKSLRYFPFFFIYVFFYFSFKY